jgi:hypothetical protein
VWHGTLGWGLHDGWDGLLVHPNQIGRHDAWHH